MFILHETWFNVSSLLQLNACCQTQLARVVPPYPPPRALLEHLYHLSTMATFGKCSLHMFTSTHESWVSPQLMSSILRRFYPIKIWIDGKCDQYGCIHRLGFVIILTVNRRRHWHLCHAMLPFQPHFPSPNCHQVCHFNIPRIGKGCVVTHWIELKTLAGDPGWVAPRVQGDCVAPAFRLEWSVVRVVVCRSQ